MELKCHLKWVLPLLAAIISFGCSFSHRPVPITNASDGLTPDQIISFTAKAQSGDGDAAFRLSNYYFFMTSDENTALKWLSVGATNNNEAAEYNLGWWYGQKTNRSLTDLNNAKYWFGRAAAKGDTNALEQLRKLEKR